MAWLHVNREIKKKLWLSYIFLSAPNGTKINFRGINITKASSRAHESNYRGEVTAGIQEHQENFIGASLSLSRRIIRELRAVKLISNVNYQRKRAVLLYTQHVRTIFTVRAAFFLQPRRRIITLAREYSVKTGILRPRRAGTSWIRGAFIFGGYRPCIKMCNMRGKHQRRVWPFRWRKKNSRFIGERRDSALTVNFGGYLMCALNRLIEPGQDSQQIERLSRCLFIVICVRCCPCIGSIIRLPVRQISRYSSCQPRFGYIAQWRERV